MVTTVCLSDDDGHQHIDKLLKSKYTAKDMGTLGFEDSDVKTSSVVQTVCSGSGQIKLDNSWTVNFTWDMHPSSSKNLDATRTPRQ